MSRVAIVADASLAELVGADAAGPVGAPALDVAVCVGDVEAPPGVPAIRIVPPFPAADELFERGGVDLLGAGVLVVGVAERRERVVAALSESGVPAHGLDSLEADSLLAAACVLVVDEPGQPFPTLGPAVLATGRVLVCPRAEPACGFLDGIDHLAYDTEAEALAWAGSVPRNPAAFRLMRAMGRAHAEAHRASTVYARALAGVYTGATSS